ncbi:MAG TPA: ubiquinol-cytochrome c reductase iron-sulfur subunit [Dehalococcoidia bacterium]|jgi:cytochrome b6-f complex iron-sulfur subunit|nr:ubiquinol-cytochrome c reductase iron-sulfur subunit [Dehalococcoidia bacterium]
MDIEPHTTGLPAPAPAAGHVAVPGRAPAVGRRRLLIASFWASIGAALVGGASTLLNTLYPRDVGGFGGPIVVPPNAIPAPGDPPKPVVEGRFLLVNLAADEGAAPGDDRMATGGLLALYRKCPHLGCTVPWREDASYHDLHGVFLCPCHGSTYTKAGVRVFGPAPRSLDTMAIEVQKSGAIVVQTGDITPGATDNPSRAVPYQPGGEA